MGTSHDQFARLVEGVGGRDEVAALELNASCPNVKSGLVVGESPEEARSLLQRLRPLTQKPLLVKLTPNVADPVPVALAAEEGGADAVSLINTLRATAIAPGSADPWLGGGTGGLSGPAVRSVALAQIGAVASAVSVPMVAMGGISSGRDAAEMISVGRKDRCGWHRELPRSGRRIEDRGRAGGGAGTDLRLDGSFFHIPRKGVSAPGGRGYTAAPCRPRSSPPTPPPRDHWTSGWRPSGGPTTSGRSGPS